ncbi:MAG TPA: penicillin-binding transpeptidase domain-containing protein [Terracidiphilus sp.]|jgi:membrane peptidoglycan carboxypeptidase|nr:penicillin-binding transpeptidase domain-containing protein [Terracidiphilus sp.]
MGAATAVALDTPHTLHRPRATAHLSATHARGHHALAHRAVAAGATHRLPHHATHSAVAAGTHATLHRASLHVRRHRYYERFTASSFAAPGIFDADVTAGEDPVVRQAAIDALDGMNGTAVVIDPSNGRILAMVNQKLALSPGAEPCSTIKLSVALAALSEGLVTSDTMVRLPGFRMNMTQAIAHSNNLYFEELGRELGFDRVRHYATMFGLGELAGYNIAGEQLGEYPDEPIPASEGGVGRMCSFGQGVSMTPLQLGAFVASIANGGTLYYLQHPTSQAEVAAFEPRVKRTLDIARYTPDLEPGMAGAVEYGTARRLHANFSELPVFGKTGTCSDNGTRFGWFVSYSQTPQGNLVTVFFLEGGRPTFGPRAAELTGAFYKNLWDRNYFAEKGQQTTALAPAAVPASPASTSIQ